MKAHPNTIQFRKDYGQLTCQRIIDRLNVKKSKKVEMPEIIKIKKYLR